MKIEISRDEMIAVLLNRIATMDPEDAREELWQHYSDNILPKLDDGALAAMFYEKVVVEDTADDDDDDESADEENVAIN